VARAASQTLVAATADSVTFTADFRYVQIYNKDAAALIYATTDGSVPVAGADNTFVVLPNSVGIFPNQIPQVQPSGTRQCVQTFQAQAAAGTFILSWGPPGLVQSVTLPFSATAAQVQAALSAIGLNVQSVTGGPANSGSFTATWFGNSVLPVVLNTAGLTTPTVSQGSVAVTPIVVLKVGLISAGTPAYTVEGS
jgi:hypothetical protein